MSRISSITLALAIATFALSGCASTGGTKAPEAPAAAANGGGSARPPAKPAAKEIKPFDQVIKKGAKKDEGLFNVYLQEEKYYYEIPDSLLGREMLMVSRIARTASDIGYGGEKNNTQVLIWEKEGKKILLRRRSHENTANDTLPVYQAVRNSNLDPIILSFDIEAFSKDSAGSVIDVTPMFAKDVPAIGLQEGRRKSYQVRRLDEGRSYIDSIRSYPLNIEARHIMTYEAGNAPSNSDIGAITLEINHSMILLPKEPMQPREYDERVGFFSVSQTDYGVDAQRAENKTYVTRWKLVPKDPEAYLRGELVEPVNPIVYYIDPATPEKWRPYLKQGVDDWQVAFEAAGFKNAIYAADPPTPEEDPEFSPEDIRYSVIRYFASPVQNAYGPHVHDPRSGQILESDIGWYHNVMNLLRNWFFVQTAAANPDARGTKFDDAIMGELIRFVSAHEVGHTLGLPHNFGSSYAYPVDSLRSPTFTANHGTAPSIMDYARFNYIAQPGDGVKNFYPRVGEYDKWNVKWGYTWFGDMSIEEQEATLNRWVNERADDPRFFYGRQTGSKIDPRSQNEDLGNDAMKASELGLKNLERIMTNLDEWIANDGEDFDNLEELYGQILGQWNRYMGHVFANIGGVYEDDKVFGQSGPVYTPVQRDVQKRAMNFLDTYAFSTPTWAMDKQILGKTNQASFVDDFRGVQSRILNSVMDPQRIARLLEYEQRANGTYKAVELFDDMRGAIFKEVRNNRPIDMHRRNLQRAYVERMEYLMTEELPNMSAAMRSWVGFTPIDVSQSDIRALAREQLTMLKGEVDRAASRTADRMTKLHLNDLSERIENILDPK